MKEENTRVENHFFTRSFVFLWTRRLTRSLTRQGGHRTSFHMYSAYRSSTLSTGRCCYQGYLFVDVTISRRGGEVRRGDGHIIRGRTNFKVLLFRCLRSSLVKGDWVQYQHRFCTVWKKSNVIRWNFCQFSSGHRWQNIFESPGFCTVSIPFRGSPLFTSGICVSSSYSTSFMSEISLSLESRW